ncbi:MAG: hypothetical protein MUC62_05980 [Candidatus Thermoplasmatota archaeon]|nr:hypothetical protein [Candidatus Thermoplasmatota archaeon]
MFEPKHAAIALVAMAICINVGYAIFEGGFKGQFLENVTENRPGPDLPYVLTIEPPREGDIGTLSRNLSLIVRSTSDEMTGIIELWGTTGISLREGSVLRNEESSFQLMEEINGTVDISLLGSLTRTITLPLDSGDGTSKAIISTSVNAQPSYGPSLRSVTDTITRPSEALSSVMPWSFLIADTQELRDGTEWTAEQDAVLEGLSLPMDRSKISYRAMVTGIEDGLRKAVLTAECSPFPGLNIVYTLIMDDAHPWPLDLDVRAEGMYLSDDGPVAIDLRYRESMISWSKGTGQRLSWPGPYKDQVPLGIEISDVGAVPTGGSGISSFTALPSQCFEHAKGASPALADFVGSQGPVSPMKLSYYRNDSRPTDRSWVWNVTLTSSPAVSDPSAMGFRVSCLSGDRFGRDQLELLEVRPSRTVVVPPPGRKMLTLSSHETVIRSSPLSDSFFTVEGYSQSYRLDIVHRGRLGPDPMNALLQNMLGMHRSSAGDLYISTSNDRMDPKTLCISVVDGSTGSLISTTKAGGSFTVLLSSYGFELA